MDERALLQEQVDYYRARAGEYDEWFFRQGRYDRGPAHRDSWLAEVAIVEAALNKSVRHEPREAGWRTGSRRQARVAVRRLAVATRHQPQQIVPHRYVRRRTPLLTAALEQAGLGEPKTAAQA